MYQTWPLPRRPYNHPRMIPLVPAYRVQLGAGGQGPPQQVVQAAVRWVVFVPFAPPVPTHRMARRSEGRWMLSQARGPGQRPEPVP